MDLVDLNLKTGIGSIHGYGYATDRDGNKFYLKYEGKWMKAGGWDVVWTMPKGTGKFEVVQGKGTWFPFYTAGPMLIYLEWEGEVELPR